MTLETLAKDIAKSAEAEASAMVKAANSEAKAILAEANEKAGTIRSEASARTEREAIQIAREVVASARQANQKEILIARRKVLDETFQSTSDELGNPKLSGRASLLKTLMAKADKIGGNDYTIRPVELDRKSLSFLNHQMVQCPMICALIPSLNLLGAENSLKLIQYFLTEG